MASNSEFDRQEAAWDALEAGAAIFNPLILPLVKLLRRHGQSGWRYLVERIPELAPLSDRLSRGEQVVVEDIGEAIEPVGQQPAAEALVRSLRDQPREVGDLSRPDNQRAQRLILIEDALAKMGAVCTFLDRPVAVLGSFVADQNVVTSLDHSSLQGGGGSRRSSRAPVTHNHKNKLLTIRQRGTSLGDSWVLGLSKFDTPDAARSACQHFRRDGTFPGGELWRPLEVASITIEHGFRLTDSARSLEQHYARDGLFPRRHLRLPVTNRWTNFIDSLMTLVPTGEPNI